MVYEDYLINEALTKYFHLFIWSALIPPPQTAFTSGDEDKRIQGNQRKAQQESEGTVNAF